MKRSSITLLLVCLAGAGAAWLVGSASALSYQDQLLGVAAHQAFGDAAPQIVAEPPEVQALLLDYADDERLLLKARSALLRYPELARRLLPIYGIEPEFQEILLAYGEAVLPPIAYFMDHDLTSLELRRALGERWRDVQRVLSRLAGNRPETVPGDAAPALTPEQRGWYAINCLREDGYGFLGQFTVTPDGRAHWVQSERVLEGLSGFFFGGVRDLGTGLAALRFCARCKVHYLAGDASRTALRCPICALMPGGRAASRAPPAVARDNRRCSASGRA